VVLRKNSPPKSAEVSHTEKIVSLDTLHLLYTANGLALHSVVDSSGRSLTFNYGDDGIRSLTQTWIANLEGLSRTWAIGN
jgi:hypothetical protein